MEDPNSCEFRLVSAFLAMEPINLLIPIARELGRGSITEEVQKFIHEECINNKICRKYPLSQFYVKSLLKQIIIDAESQSQEVLDVFYEKYAQYLINCKDYDLSQTGKCYRALKFVFPAFIDSFSTSFDNQWIRESVIMTVILRSSPNMLEGGTGCSIWPSSLFLSEFILSHPQIFSSRCCFEIGSGAGLVGICLANIKASKVILSDGDLSALANLKHNLQINHVVMAEQTKQEFHQDHRLVECRHLKWESASQDDLQNCGADVILGADIIYDTSCVPPLVRVLAALLQKRSSDLKQLTTNSKENSFENTITEVNQENSCNENKDSSIFYTNTHPVAYVATVIRNIDTFDCFLRLAFEAGLRVINITKVMGSLNLLPYLPSLDRSSVNLYMISSLHS